MAARKKRRTVGLSAATADRYALYEQSVQDPAADIVFIERTFRRRTGRRPKVLREDFCGTAALAGAWVRSGGDRHAVGRDIDARVLAAARARNADGLGAAGRLTLLRQDVRVTTSRPVDACVAFNYSYWVFTSRAELRGYFESVRASLGQEGAFFLDAYGGPAAQKALVERTRRRGFTYVWEHEAMDALSARAIRHIHFEFPDGTRLNEAFTYHWRIWTLPEIRELLHEAGFADVEVYWEGATPRGTGNGIFRRVRRADNEESWVVYIVAWA